MPHAVFATKVFLGGKILFWSMVLRETRQAQEIVFACRVSVIGILHSVDRIYHFLILFFSHKICKKIRVDISLPSPSLSFQCNFQYIVLGIFSLYSTDHNFHQRNAYSHGNALFLYISFFFHSQFIT